MVTKIDFMLLKISTALFTAFFQIQKLLIFPIKKYIYIFETDINLSVFCRLDILKATQIIKKINNVIYLHRILI